jgi:hypothetical protein
MWIGKPFLVALLHDVAWFCVHHFVINSGDHFKGRLVLSRGCYFALGSILENIEDSRLWTSANKTLNEFVRISTEDTVPIVMQLVHVIMHAKTQRYFRDGRAFFR